jgi:hypothetical protein
MEHGAAPAESAVLEREPAVPAPLPPLRVAPGPMAGGAPRAASLSPATVLALQRSSGNASVARLLADVVPPGLLDSLTGVQKTVSGTDAAVQDAEGKAGAAEGKLDEAPRELEGNLAGVEEPHAQAAGAQEQQAGEQSAKVQQDTSALQDEGTRASAQVDAVAPVAPSLLSPARAIVEPSAVAADAGRIDELGPAVAGPGAAGLDAGGQVLQALGPGAQPEWNVDLAEVVGTAGGLRAPVVGGAVPLAERRSGEERLGQITAFAGQLGGRVSRLAGGLGSGITAMGGQAGDRLQQRADGVTGLADRAASAVSDGFAAIKRGLTGDVENAKASKLAGADQQASQAREGIGGILTQARGKLSGAAETAGRLLGGLGSAASSMLPASLSGLTSAIGDAQGRVDARQAGLLPRLGEVAARAKQAIIGAAKSFADSKLREYVMRERIMQQAIDGARKLAQTIGKAVSALVPPRIKALGAKIEAAAAGEMAKLQAAADGVVGKLRDGACVVLEKVGGPYVRQYLPDLNNQINNTVKITASTDLIVPLEEIGIPANLKVAAGASVSIGVLSGVYTVKVTGEAALLANELIGKEAHAGLTDTGPVLTPTAQAFNALGGSGPAPAVAAKIGGAVAGAGDAATSTGDAASPGGTRAEIDAGLKGSVNAEWRFDAVNATTSCDGIGGMLALLGGLGASAALPAPFNQIGGQAVFKSFMPNLQTCRFSVGGVASADVDVKAGGLADIKLRGGAEVMENVELTRDQAGKLVAVRTRTLQADLDATAVAGLASGSFAKYRAFIGGEGIVRLTLTYDKATDEVLPTALGGAVALSIGAKEFDPALIPEQLGDQVPEIRRMLASTFAGMEGPREIKATLTIGRVYEKLEPLGRELKTYFAGPLEGITVDGVLEIVHRHFATLTPTDHVKLELSQTQRKEIDVGAVAGEGAAAGADVDVTAEHTISRVWVSYSGTDEVIDLAAGRRRVAAAVVEPDKKDDKKKRKPKFPTGLTRGSPIEMIWAKPPSKYKNPINLVDGQVEKNYFRTVPQTLNGRVIGVPGFSPREGLVFQRLAFRSERGAETEFVEHLRRADFRHEGTDGWDAFAPDHVFDLGYGGDDAFSNLWPLDKATNTAASGRHGQGQIVKFSKPEDAEDDPPRETTLSRTDPRAPTGIGVPPATNRGHENIFFIIKETAS